MDTYDLDAVIAEQDAPPFPFRFGGEDFHLPGSMDLRVVRLFSAGDPLAALEALLGAEQFARFDAVDRVFDDRAFKALLDQYGAHLGVGRGE
jgi:hypothetical protein